MGPPTKRKIANKVENAKSVIDINDNSNMRRCLLCRSDACSTTTTSRTREHELEGCATSLCLIFGLPDNHSHPLKQLLLYENTDYCKSCLGEIQEADLTLGQLQVLKQSLLRFQSVVYRKLGDNYFQIDSLNSLKTTYSDLEECNAEDVRKLDLSYDELVKIIFEKIDKQSSHWESFSNAANQLVHVSTQTEARDFDENCRRDNLAFDDGCGNDLSDGEGQGADYHDDEVSICKQVSCQKPSPSGLNKSPRAKDYRSPSQNKNQNCNKCITETPINLEEKIYCTYGQCERFFYDQYNLMVHIKSFHEGIKKPHECPICKRSFIDEPRLKAHNQRRHTAELTVICDQCGQSLTSPAALRQHNRKIHGRKENSTSFNCSFCTAPSNSNAELEDHENLHRSNTSLYNCVFCSANFSDYNSSKSHFISKHRSCKFSCGICNKILSRASSLKSHLVSHTSQNASVFKCCKCDFTASSQSSVNHHKKVHSQEKTHICEICGSSYKFAKNLASHMSIHTGKNLYTCRICNAAFGTKMRDKDLMQHEQSHSEIANWENGEYDKSYSISLQNQGLSHLPKEGSNKASESTNPQASKTKKRKTMKQMEEITDEEDESKTKHGRISNSVPKSDLNLQKNSDIYTPNKDGDKNQDKIEVNELTVANKSNDEVETAEVTAMEAVKFNTVTSQQSLELYQDEMMVEIDPERVAETVTVIAETTVEVCPETQTFIITTEN